MGRTTGRAPEDTRRNLLDAAKRVIREHGIGATLDVIAREAGVSKGGLVYHFASKQALLVALAQEQIDLFRGEVDAQLVEPEGVPGRLTRAYVRASTATVDGEEIRERFSLIAQLYVVPEVVELAKEDDLRWQRDLDADGVPEATQVLVIAAADGVGDRPLWASELEPRARARLEADLIAMVDAAVADGAR
ncbi:MULTISPECIES: TetR/AcrR family transcriptional regulator [unclassified Saccharopolyspora]|uniref:TetR/AcrR family transcriptional regulator n=1 Tax=unclassified Saccharopolyspora TaxID=2646250 RepID=UPI001CD5961C|nr:MULTISPECIES: TetR/AcrR family transcriptional regulator [unclassified Saccharopolyspora]MCA1194415.1 TetR/AcrR family transcriptional regulator [Saccharopolyspora sp. 6V]MCA1228796.1 TetR/AcrR family transcriptional regulator [Saccharopolyspora sp. 6M]